MGMDLVNQKGEDFRFGIIAWGKMLQLAATAGYTPLWEIWSNDGHRVETEDALKLAEALESVVDDIPDVAVANQVVEYTAGSVPTLDSKDPYVSPFLKARFEWYLTGMSPDGENVSAIRVANPELAPVEFFSGECKGKITGFITYCRRGAFEIW